MLVSRKTGVVAPSVTDPRRTTLVPFLVVAFLAAGIYGPSRLEAEGPAESGPMFLRGDANLDGRLSLADVFAILRYLHRGAPLHCLDAADADDSGVVTTADFVHLLGTLFLRRSALPPPYPEPGIDTTADRLGCGSSLRRAAEKEEETVETKGAVRAPPCAENPNAGADSEFILFLFDEISVFPGQRNIRIPVLLDSDLGRIQGLTLSVRSDPPVLDLEEIDFSGTVLESTGGAGSWSYTYTGLRDEGYISTTLAFDIGSGEQKLQPVKRATIANLVFSVPEETPVGSVVEVRFEETPAVGASPPIPNELVRGGFVVSSSFCGMSVEIVPESRVFLRGDVNRNWDIGITDPIHIFRHLFHGSTIECPDAADANDDGEIGLSDAVLLLRFLFLGGSEPYPPFSFPSTDFANPDDGLDCIE